MALIVETPAAIVEFLGSPTPEAWIVAACGRLPELMLDHANCELKAASTALSLIYRYPERTALCLHMSRPAREELRHFEQTRKLMRDIDIPYSRLSASRYAGALRDSVRRTEPHRLLDLLLEGTKSGMKGGVALLFSAFLMLIVLTVRQFVSNRTQISKECEESQLSADGGECIHDS